MTATVTAAELLVAGIGCSAAAMVERWEVALVALGWGALQLGHVAHDDRRLGILSVRASAARWAVLAIGLEAFRLATGHSAAYESATLAAFGCGISSALIRCLLRFQPLRRLSGSESDPAVLLVAPDSHVASQELARLARSGTRVADTWVPTGTTGTSTAESRLRQADELACLVVETKADVVLVHPGCALLVDFESLSWSMEAAKARLVMSLGMPTVASHRITPSYAGGATGINLMPSRPSAVGLFVRAALERSVALSAVILLSPVLALVGLLIKIESPGPALFRQTRVREGGREFTMLKFRTMDLDAEARLAEIREHNQHGAGVLFKMRHDPRVTRVGRILRSTSLDELPQLLNVVRGDMSLIGPRPALPLEIALYDRRARRRLAAKPGVSGLWQVSGRSELSWQRSVDIDVDYVDNWSALRDVAIVLRTMKVAARREGAY
jgi:exopolysaccharide biosynthesis polyprenyl glycosylphosphotransferase